MRTVTSASSGEIFTFYNRGLSVTETQKLTNFDYKYVDGLFFKWEIQKIRDKGKALSSPQNPESKYLLSNIAATTDFFLHTTNKKVRAAYDKMITGKKQHIQY